ncbi:MAG: LuxR C-terminal-related transcriptional regulator [Vitreimonas sp.]
MTVSGGGEAEALEAERHLLLRGIGPTTGLLASPQIDLIPSLRLCSRSEGGTLISSFEPPLAILLWTRRRDRRTLSMGKDTTVGELTPKERECLYLAGRRLSDAEIAQRLDLSPRTVGNHLARAYAKLEVHDRIRAAAKLSKLYPEYSLPIGYEADDASLAGTSAHRTDAHASSIANAFAKLPTPPSRLMRLFLILAVAVGVAIVFAGVTMIMSVSADRASIFAPKNAR